MSIGRARMGAYQVLPYQSEVMKDGPILYWRLNETSGQFLDSSGNGRHGTLSGTGVRGAPGIVEGDTAFKGDLNSFVGTPLQSVAGDFTYEFWFSATSLASLSEPSACIPIGHGHSGNYGLYIYLTAGAGGRIQVASFDGAAKETLADGVPLLNGPKHICVTRVGTVVTIYVNGSDVTTTHGVHGATVDPAGMNIYVNQYVAANYSAVATYDEVAVYAKALSLDRIRAHYNARMLKFNPLSLSPKFWLDAADANTLFRDSSGGPIAGPGDKVQRWMDKGSNGFHQLQGNWDFAGSLVIGFQNSLNAVLIPSFAGYGGFGPLTTGPQYTVFMVAKLNVLPTSGQSLMFQNGNAGDGYGITANYGASGPTTSIHHGGIVYKENGPANTNTELTTILYDGSNGRMRRNKVEKTITDAATAFNPPTYFQLNWGADLHLMELLVFQNALSNSDILRVEDYLSAKWAVPGLPVKLGASGWWDASDPNSMFDAPIGGNAAIADGQVARWQDKSGFNRHVTQTVAAARPIRKAAALNGLDLVQFDGIDDRLSGAFGSQAAWTVCMLARRPGTPSSNTYPRLFSQVGDAGAGDTGPGHWIPMIGVTGTNKIFTYANDGFQLGGAEPSLGGVFDYVVTHSGAEIRQYYNGTHNGTIDSTLGVNGAEIHVGGTIVSPNDFMAADIAEIIVLPYVVSDSQRLTIRDYLLTKWKIPSDPDADNYIGAVTSAMGVAPTPAQCDAITGFIIGEKTAKRWALIKQMILPVWGNSSANLIDLKTRGSWWGSGGTITHGAGFIQGDGASGYVMVSSFVDNGMSLNNGHVMAFAVDKDSRAGGFTYFGVSDNTSNDGSAALYPDWGSGNAIAWWGWTNGSGATAVTVFHSTMIGVFTMNANADDFTLRIFNDEADRGNASAVTNPSYPLPSSASGPAFMAWHKNDGNFYEHTDAKFGALSVGLGMTDFDIEAFSVNVEVLWKSVTGLSVPVTAVTFPTSGAGGGNTPSYPEIEAALTIPLPVPLATLAPALWLDANDPATLFSDEAGTSPAVIDGPVGRWGDKSGNGWHGTQSAPGNCPLRKTVNKLPGLLFEGKHLRHLLDQPAGNTVFVVASRTGTLFNLQGLFAATAPNQPMACYLAGKSSGVENWGGYRLDLGHFNSGHRLKPSPSVVTMTSSTTGGVMRHNKRIETSYASNAFHQDALERRLIGSAGTTQDFWYGYIHEIIVLPYVASPVLRGQIQDYLMVKWRIDHDAVEYLEAVTAAGVTPTAAQANTITAFILAEKAAGRWTRHKRIYLPIWANAAANAIDMVDRAVGTWSGSIVHANGYVEGGANGAFLATPSITALGLSRNDHCLSALIYRGHQGSGYSTVMAGLTNVNGLQMLESPDHNLELRSVNPAALTHKGNTGVFVGSRTASNAAQLLRRTANGITSVAGEPVSQGFFNQGISVFRRQTPGGALQGNHRIGVVHIGLGLSEIQATAFSANLKTLWQRSTGLAIP